MLKSSPAKARKIIEGVHEFLQQELWPREQELLTGDTEETIQLLALLREKIKAANLWALHLPDMYGGLSLPARDFARICEELGRSPLGHHIFNCQDHVLLTMALIMDKGTYEQKERYLRPLVRGEIGCGTGLTDQTLFTPAEELPRWQPGVDSESLYLSGTQRLVSASSAMDFFTLAAAPTEGGQPGLFIVPADCNGLSLEPEPLTATTPYSSQVHFCARLDNCELPAGLALGDDGDALALLEKHLIPVRIFSCMRWIGICERTLSIAARRIAKPRVPAAGTSAISQDETSWIADVRAEINAGRLLVLTTAHKIDKEGPEQARDDSALCLFHIAGILRRLFDRVNRMFSSQDILAEPVLAHWMYRERNAGIYEIPGELLRLQVAAKLLQRFKIK